MAETKAQAAASAARQIKKNAKEAQRAVKRQQMEQKKKNKSEEKQAERLRRVIVTYEENNHKNEQDHVVQMIDSNPACLGPQVGQGDPARRRADPPGVGGKGGKCRGGGLRREVEWQSEDFA